MTPEFANTLQGLISEASGLHLGEQDMAIAVIVQAYIDQDLDPDPQHCSRVYREQMAAKLDAVAFLNDWRFETYCTFASIKPSLVRGLYQGLLSDTDPAKIAAWPFRHSIRCGSSQVADLI